MALSSIKNLVSDEFIAVNHAIIEALHSKVPMIEKIGHYLVKSGGKRIRPLLHLLCAKSFDAPLESMVKLAAIIEFIHTATLLHDDVVDGSKLRRGRPTANAVWDNATAVLVGDFVYSRSFQMMVELDNPDIMRVLAETTNSIAEGEVLQCQRKGNPELSEKEYFNIIESKTAKLFEAASLLGAIIGKQDSVTQRALARFGTHLGTAFQIIDDVLDYQSSDKILGKNLGDDLAEGKVTLPLIHALNNSPRNIQKQLKKIIKSADIAKFSIIKEAMVETDAIKYTITIAKEKIDNALSELMVMPDNKYKNALQELAIFTLQRAH
jgi:octaprenyl-diphosphate synthase